MEDAHFVLNGAKIGDVLGVLDGCGGANASNFCSVAMQRALVAVGPTRDASEVLADTFAVVEDALQAEGTFDRQGRARCFFARCDAEERKDEV